MRGLSDMIDGSSNGDLRTDYRAYSMSASIDCVSPESLGLSSSRLDRVADYLKEYVDSGKLAGYLVLVTRRGQPVYLHRYGLRDVEAQTPVEEDTIFRIYSMTNPKGH